MEGPTVLDVKPVVISPVSSHHEALGVSPASTAAEITKAYRRQSLRWHPDKNVKNKVLAERRFQEITDAYAALVDSETGKLKEVNVVERKYTGPAMVGMHKSTVSESIVLSLDELFRGVKKVKDIRRGRMRQGDRVEEHVRLAIPIPAGTRPGTKLYYPDQGDQVFGGQIADLLFEVKAAPHSLYRWVGDDLIHRHVLHAGAAVRRDLRLERFSELLIGKPAAPLAAYCNIMSELSGVAVTLVPPQSIPAHHANGLTVGQPQHDAGGCAWKVPQGRGMKMKDKDTTATRLRIPGAMQAAIGKQSFTANTAFHSVAWKINKKTDEVAVGMAHPEANLDRKYYGDVSRAHWGIVWTSDGKLCRVGIDTSHASVPRYGPGDVLQMTVHTGEGLLLLFKNEELVFCEGDKILVATKDVKDGDVASMEGMGMPVLGEGKVVGRGDLLVQFCDAAKPTIAAVQQAAAEADEQDAADRLRAWLALRKHPEPLWEMNEWGEGGTKKFQTKVTLNQKRPFVQEGKFDGVTMMGRMVEGKDAAADSAAAKALRMLDRLTERFPEVHQRKRARNDAAGPETAVDAVSTAVPSMCTAESTELPPKRQKTEDVRAPAAPPADGDLDDID